MRVTQGRQLIRCVADRSVERRELVTECRLDESGQSACRLAAFAHVVHDGFEVGVGPGLGDGDQPAVEVFDGAVETFGGHPPHFLVDASTGLDLVPHVTSQLWWRAGSNVAFKRGVKRGGDGGGQTWGPDVGVQRDGRRRDDRPWHR